MDRNDAETSEIGGDIQKPRQTVVENLQKQAKN